MSDFSIRVKRELLKFVVADNAFIPTGTSKLMIDGVRNIIDSPVKLLDLGCGIGIVGISLDHIGLVNGPLYASDLGASAVAAAKLNCERYGCEAIVKNGSLYEPWKDNKFDCIVNDISGIAKEIAEISPWFEGVSCEAGKDGVLLVNQVISQSKTHLNDEGKLFFPAISLSDTDKIINEAKNNFSNVDCVMRKTWPLPNSMMKHKKLILELNEEGVISIEEKFGSIQWYTEIYVAYN